MTRPTLGLSDGAPVRIDVERLLETRALLTASSGWGKSWALRRVIEQTHGRGAMQLVIDPEGEFASLREQFDFVIAGKGGDCPAEPRSADLLARRLLELGSSAVLDLYELSTADRVRFVRRFLEALIDAPKKLWRPVLVVIDEVHMFAPEGGACESRDAVRGLMTRGRKRGFAGLLASQRLAKVDKDSCDAGNVMIGRYTLDVDVKRAADSLGFPKARYVEVQRLGRGEFWCHGPALSEEVILVKVGDVATSHPKSGQHASAPPAPRGTVLKVLEQLRDLPAEAEAEARSADELREKLRQVERELAAAKRGSVDPAALDRARSEGRAEVAEGVAREAHQLVARVVASAEGGRERASRALDQALEQIKRAADALREPIDVPEMAAPPRIVSQRLSPSPAVGAFPASAGDGPSTYAPARGGEARMLTVLAQHFPQGLPEGQWATLSRLKRTGGTWSTYKSRLRSRGHYEERGDLNFATEAGVEAAGVVPERPSTTDGVLAMWETKPGMGPAVRLVRIVLEHGGRMAPDALAEAAGLTHGAGTFSTYVSRARTAGLLDADSREVVVTESVLNP